MQRNQINPLTTGDWAVIKTPVPRCGDVLLTAQIVADGGDTLSVVAQGETGVREVPRANVESYQDVYGTSVPVPGARPIVNQIHK
jgi:hypothetical protein